MGSVDILKPSASYNTNKTVDEYFDYLMSLKESNDIHMLKKTIEANNHVFKVSFQDVKYLKRIIKKVRYESTNKKKQLEKVENKYFNNEKKDLMKESSFHFSNILNTFRKGSIFNTNLQELKSRRESEITPSVASKQSTLSPGKRFSLVTQGWELNEQFSHKAITTSKFNANQVREIKERIITTKINYDAEDSAELEERLKLVKRNRL